MTVRQCSPGPNLDDAYYPALKALGAAMQVPPAWLLLVMWVESTLQPNCYVHFDGGLEYAGLNQMNGGYLNDHGVAPVDYATWSASDQLTKIVGPWYQAQAAQALHGTPAPTPGALYAVNFLPGRVQDRGMTEDVVLTESPENYYTANKGLDVTHDGKITIGDLDMFLASHAANTGYVSALLTLGLDSINRPPPPEPPPPGPNPQPPTPKPVPPPGTGGPGSGWSTAAKGVALVLSFVAVGAIYYVGGKAR